MSARGLVLAHRGVRHARTSRDTRLSDRQAGEAQRDFLASNTVPCHRTPPEWDHPSRSGGEHGLETTLRAGGTARDAVRALRPTRGCACGLGVLLRTRRKGLPDRARGPAPVGPALAD